jgi:hypothetical protein
MNYAIPAILVVYGAGQFLTKLKSPAPADHPILTTVFNLGFNGIAILAIMVMGWRMRQIGAFARFPVLRHTWPHIAIPCAAYLLILTYELGGALNINAGLGYLVIAAYAATMLLSQYQANKD